MAAPLCKFLQQKSSLKTQTVAIPPHVSFLMSSAAEKKLSALAAQLMAVFPPKPGSRNGGAEVTPLEL